MNATSPPWLSAMQKVVATFVDSSQTPPNGALFLVVFWRRRCSYVLNKIDIAPLRRATSVLRKPVKGLVACSARVGRKALSQKVNQQSLVERQCETEV